MLTCGKTNGGGVKQHLEGGLGVCNRGTGGSEFPASRTLYFRFLPLLLWFPPFCAFYVAKYYAMLQKLFQFLLVPANLGIPLPAHSSSAFHRLASPLLLGSNPCPPFTIYIFTVSGRARPKNPLGSRCTFGDCIQNPPVSFTKSCGAS